MSAAHVHEEQTAVRFGRYEVIQTLGTGGMASVYLAMLHEGGRPSLLALKQSHCGSSSDNWAEALKEAKCGASIRHPNVVGMMEMGVGAKGPYMVMEYVEGGTLCGLLSQGATSPGFARRLPPRIACRVILDALLGLHAAHEATDPSGNRLGLIHRDVSPQNVLVGTDGLAKLADFGIAKLLQSSTTAPGLLRGKPGYVAPEQAMGQAVDPRTDLFSMGIVMWECMTGKRLFRGKDQQDSLLQIVRTMPADLHELHPDIPPAISSVCRMALAKSKAARPASAAEFAALLEAAAVANNVLASHDEVGNYVKETLAVPLARRARLLSEWCSHTGMVALIKKPVSLVGQAGPATPRTNPPSASRPGPQPAPVSNRPEHTAATLYATSELATAMTNEIVSAYARKVATPSSPRLAPPTPPTEMEPWPEPSTLSEHKPLNESFALEPSGVRVRTKVPVWGSTKGLRVGGFGKSALIILGMVAIWFCGYASATFDSVTAHDQLAKAKRSISAHVARH
jgi:serine/threonine protein kinase